MDEASFKIPPGLESADYSGKDWSVPEELWFNLRTIYNNAATEGCQLTKASPAMEYFVANGNDIPKKPSGKHASDDLPSLVEILTVIICNFSARDSELERNTQQRDNEDSPFGHFMP